MAMGATRSAAGILAALALSLGLSACGGADEPAGPLVDSRTGAFSVPLPEQFQQIDMSDQPPEIELGLRDDGLGQVVATRYNSAGEAETNAQMIVTTLTTSGEAACETIDLPGATFAWLCSTEDEVEPFERVFAAMADPEQSVLLLFQADPGQAADLARGVVAGFAWS
ncbi:MAG: hypothetical protein Q4G67_02665 [Actinomycetia bacterium]|nr:hypothetical protein [Actinomycetes bacterium]